MTITNKLIKHQIFLERFAGGIALKMQAGIDSARNEAILNTIGGVENVDIKALQASLVQIVNKAMQAALSDIKELAKYEADFNVKLLKKELSEVSEAVEATLIAALLNKPMPVGLADKGVNRKIDPAFKKFSEQTARQLIQPIKDVQLLGGDTIIASETMAALAAGLLSAQARSLSRSSVVHAANTSKEEVYKVNPITQVEWISVLDSSTTPYCRGQDGKVYDIGKGPRPPAHYNCRSITRPLI